MAMTASWRTWLMISAASLCKRKLAEKNYNNILSNCFNILGKQLLVVTQKSFDIHSYNLSWNNYETIQVMFLLQFHITTARLHTSKNIHEQYSIIYFSSFLFLLFFLIDHYNRKIKDLRDKLVFCIIFCFLAVIVFLIIFIICFCQKGFGAC